MVKIPPTKHTHFSQAKNIDKYPQTGWMVLHPVEIVLRHRIYWTWGIARNSLLTRNTTAHIVTASYNFIYRIRSLPLSSHYSVSCSLFCSRQQAFDCSQWFSPLEESLFFSSFRLFNWLLFFFSKITWCFTNLFGSVLIFYLGLTLWFWELKRCWKCFFCVTAKETVSYFILLQKHLFDSDCVLSLSEFSPNIHEK